MATFSDEITALLQADTTLTSILTGNIHNYPSTGRKGLERLLTPQAFNGVIGLIKPTAIVLEIDEKVDNQIVGQNTSIVVPIYIWLYNDSTPDANGLDPYTPIAAAFDRLYALLHLAQITDACQILYVGGTKYKRDPDLQDAAFWRADFNVYAYR